jgi:hypothetical protein
VGEPGIQHGIEAGAVGGFALKGEQGRGMAAVAAEILEAQAAAPGGIRRGGSGAGDGALNDPTKSLARTRAAPARAQHCSGTAAVGRERGGREGALGGGAGLATSWRVARQRICLVRLRGDKRGASSMVVSGNAWPLASRPSAQGDQAQEADESRATTAVAGYEALGLVTARAARDHMMGHPLRFPRVAGEAHPISPEPVRRCPAVAPFPMHARRASVLARPR